jgi:hypothetical protein
MLHPIGGHAKGERGCFGPRFGFAGAIGQVAGQFRHFADPAAVRFVLGVEQSDHPGCHNRHAVMMSRLPPARSMLFPAMNVCGDKGDRRWPPVFNPMRPRAKFRKHLTGPKLLRHPVVMVIGENPAEGIDDRRVTLGTVEGRPAQRWRD